MAQYKTDGIVLDGKKFGEADRILHILTKDRGKISAIAKGVRKGTSKFSGSLEPIMVNSFLLAEGKNLDIVCQVQNLKSYPVVRSSYDLIMRAGSLLEAASKLTEEGLPDEATYELLLAALDAINSGSPSEVVELVFKTGLLKANGIFPELSGCNKCGKTQSRAIHFDSRNSAFICDDCAKSDGVYHPVSNEALSVLYKASRIDWETSLGLEESTGEEINLEPGVILADELLAAFIQSNLGRAEMSRNV